MRWFLIFLLSGMTSTSWGQVTTAFTYQGELEQSAAPATGEFDFRFELFDADLEDVSIAGPVVIEDRFVDGGLFATEVDFGVNVFGLEDVWLEIGVRDAASTGSFTILLPRQKVTPAPLALHALNVEPGAVGPDQLAVMAVGSANVDSSEIQLRIGDSCVSGSWVRAINADGTLVCETDPGGDITAVLAGPGLSGGGSAGAVSLSIENGSVTSAMIADGTLVFADLADNGCDPAQVIRFSGGSWVCEEEAPNLVSVHVPLDSAETRLVAIPTERALTVTRVSASWTEDFTCFPNALEPTIELRADGQLKFRQAEIPPQTFQDSGPMTVPLSPGALIEVGGLQGNCPARDASVTLEYRLGDPGDVLGCPVGFSACGDSCVDLSSDRGSCGSCGAPCPAGSGACCDGNCADLECDPQNCGGCGASCPPGFICAGGCVESCDALAQDCSQPGEACYVGFTNCSSSAVQICAPVIDPSNTQGAACESLNDCAEGFHCVSDGISNSCAAFCAVGGGSPSCEPGLTCTPLGDPADVGVCL